MIKFFNPSMRLDRESKEYSLANIYPFLNPIRSRCWCMGCHLLIFKNGSIILITSNHILEIIKLFNGFGVLWKNLIRNNLAEFYTFVQVHHVLLFMGFQNLRVIVETIQNSLLLAHNSITKTHSPKDTHASTASNSQCTPTNNSSQSI